MPNEAKRRLRLLRLRQGVVVDDALRLSRLKELQAEPALGGGTRLFIVNPDEPPHPPAWVEFLDEAAAEELPEIASSLNGAVLVIPRNGRLWLLTFGTGHLFVNEDFADPRFGLRTVLNLVDPEQLRSVGSRIYEDVIVRTMKQVSRRSSRASSACGAASLRRRAPPGAAERSAAALSRAASTRAPSPATPEAAGPALRPSASDATAAPSPSSARAAAGRRGRAPPPRTSACSLAEASAATDSSAATTPARACATRQPVMD